MLSAPRLEFLATQQQMLGVQGSLYQPDGSASASPSRDI